MRFGSNYSMIVEVAELLSERYTCNTLVHLKCILSEIPYYFDAAGFLKGIFFAYELFLKFLIVHKDDSCFVMLV